jgi:hypothetical protein
MSNTPYEAYRRELAALLELVLAARLVDDWAAVERLVVHVVGAQSRVLEAHPVDEHGRCSICRAAPRGWWWPWPRRVPCKVYSALGLDSRQPGRFVLSTLTGRVSVVGGRS